MRKPGWTPSIVPKGEGDQNVYIVLDDFGRSGRAYRESDVERADLEAVIMDMLDGQYKNPVRVVGFNTGEKWSQDVSGDVAQELRAHPSCSSGGSGAGKGTKRKAEPLTSGWRCAPPPVRRCCALSTIAVVRPGGGRWGGFVGDGRTTASHQGTDSDG
jgi:hypothetical protein